MKKIFLIMTLIVVMSVCFVGCGTTYQEVTQQTEKKESGNNNDFGNGYFTIILEWESISSDYKIVYANDTRVKYFICTTGYKFGITPLYNADGTLQIHEREY